jgi:hypothetical protein
MNRPRQTMSALPLASPTSGTSKTAAPRGPSVLTFRPRPWRAVLWLLTLALGACSGPGALPELEPSARPRLVLVTQRGPTPLTGRTVSGRVTVRLQGAVGARGVAFYLDDPKTQPLHVAYRPPFEVTLDLSGREGHHTLFATLLPARGQRQTRTSAAFTVQRSSAAKRERGLTYYLDCHTGDDHHAGTAPERAWRTLERANRFQLRAGDALLLKRGCAWQGPLEVPWRGSAERPVRVGAYGLGAPPLIHDGAWVNVNITGSHVVVEHLETKVDTTRLPRDPTCNDQPYGWKVGFYLAPGATHVTLRHVQASGHTAGVHIDSGASYNRVLHSEFSHNTVMSQLSRAHPDDDSGAWGVLLNGDHNVVAYNRFGGNVGCSHDYGEDGAAVEVYGAVGNAVHHNLSVDDLAFAELGGEHGNRTRDTLFAYNLAVSRRTEAQFLIMRGAKSPWGPTANTEVYHNTVYLTGARSEGLICYGGCSEAVLTARNNVFWAEHKAIYADGPFGESHNLFWRRGGDPWIDLSGTQLHATSRIARPLFVDPDAGDFRPRPESPTVDEGTPLQRRFGADLGGVPVPQRSVADIGAYEWEGPAAAGFY